GRPRVVRRLHGDDRGRRAHQCTGALERRALAHRDDAGPLVARGVGEHARHQLGPDARGIAETERHCGRRQGYRDSQELSGPSYRSSPQAVRPPATHGSEPKALATAAVPGSIIERSSDAPGGLPHMALTHDVATFIVETPAEAIPPSVRELGIRSILDGLGLALAGQVAETGHLVREYLADLGCAAGPSTVFGTSLRTAPRFAAFANGVAIHADDYDDTQLAVAPDRVYGLLTHPTAPVLPAVLALAERDGRSGQDAL